MNEIILDSPVKDCGKCPACGDKILRGFSYVGCVKPAKKSKRDGLLVQSCANCESSWYCETVTKIDSQKEGQKEGSPFELANWSAPANALRWRVAFWCAAFMVPVAMKLGMVLALALSDLPNR